MRGRKTLLVGSVAAALGFGAAPALAEHHEVKISQVFAGTMAMPSLEYVELEMVASGQNFFLDSNAKVTLHGINGGVTRMVDLNQNLANGQRGRRILIGSDADVGEDVATQFGVDPDFTFNGTGALGGSAGAICFSAPGFGVGDCVTWGTLDGSGLPFPTGGPTPAIAAGQALDRRRPSCGPGLVDTNNPSNWTQVTPGPLNNAAPATTFTPCPQTKIVKKPKKRTTKRRARFTFTATQGVDEFKCKLDRRPFRNCTSPFRKRVRRGKHTFKVKADGDSSPASYSWKVVRPD